ncbi:MAG: hypothetical protein OXH52_21370 [Gammaproteobacteria bacterium]|nr:hypothetical protein [Gammaproteobacteria bacterium]
MGGSTYYIMKMKMKEVLTIRFASQVYEGTALDDATRRTPSERRVEAESAKYPGRDDKGTFSWIVIAAVGGNPAFMPVRITADERTAILRPTGIDETFGVLTFDGRQRFHALEGQGLKSIGTSVDQSETGVPEMRDGLPDAEVPVLMLVRDEVDVL